ncbi:MAG: allophycocyanin subunit beta [Leptolyngbyaceae cyanobacterium bins.302]|nr:allophycocyanin subunit beta [Leptolyngbyaceae cyanobacterium bins.302]
MDFSNAGNIQSSYRLSDLNDLSKLKSYFQTGILKVETAAYISKYADKIINKAFDIEALSSKAFQPSNKNHSSRLYAIHVRELKYLLSYAAYAMLAGDPSIIDEHCLNNFEETFESLNISIPLIVRTLQKIKGILTEVCGSEGGQEFNPYLDYILQKLQSVENKQEDLLTSSKKVDQNRVMPSRALKKYNSDSQNGAIYRFALPKRASECIPLLR